MKLSEIISETMHSLGTVEPAARRVGVTPGDLIGGHLRRRFGLVDGHVLADPQPTQALMSVRAFLRSEAKILVLCGGVGTGKSIAAAELFVAPIRESVAAEVHNPRDWESRVYTVRGSWLTAHGLARAIDPWRHERGDGHEPIDPSAGVSVLDDLGTEGDAVRFHEAFATYVDARMSASKTVITTNLAKADIRKRYGDRIADRLNHVGACVELKGQSMRRKGAGF